MVKNTEFVVGILTLPVVVPSGDKNIFGFGGSMAISGCRSLSQSVAA